MKRYDRYMLSQLLVLFGFFTLVLVAVYWINRAVDIFDDLIADGQTLAVFLEFTALSLPQVILFVIPISAFTATVYVMNRLITESEMVVLQTAGLSALRLLRPVLFYGLVVSTLTGVLGHVLVPQAKARFAERQVEVEDDLAARLLREGQFLHPATGTTLYIREITELGEFRDIFLQDRSARRVEITYTARRALLVRREDGPRLIMFDGMAQTLDDTGRLSVVDFDDFTYDLGGLREAVGGVRLEVDELPTPQLLFAPPLWAALQDYSLPEMRFEGHARIARQLAALFVPLIAGAAMMLGGFSRFGVWPQIVLAIALIVPLEISSNAARSAGEDDLSLTWVAYAQPALAAATAAVLAMLAMRGRRRPRSWAAAA